MNRDRVREQVKNELYGFLQNKGINPNKPFKCLNPDHDDIKPSMSYDKRRNKAHCFACGADYDTLDLIGIEYGLSDYNDIFDKAYELYSIDIDERTESKDNFSFKGRKDKEGMTRENSPKMDYTEFYAECYANIDKTNYTTIRGLTRATIDRFHIGYCENWQSPKALRDGKNPPHSPRLIIPVTKSSYIARDTRQDITQFTKMKEGNSQLFNLQALQMDKPVFVVEGELDAISIVEVGGESIGLGSTSNIRQLIKFITEHEVKTTKLYLALDNDKSGQKATNELLEGLQGVENIDIEVVSIYRQYKDANEFLVKDREGLRMNIMKPVTATEQDADELKEEYKGLSNGGYFDAFMSEIKDSEHKTFIPTGYSKLDEILEGGLYDGLYVIGAISSLGKTTYIMQMADQIAQQGQDVLIVSLEMARNELISKSISRLTMLESTDIRLAKTSRGITTGSRWLAYSQEEKDLIYKAMETYKGYANNIYIVEGVGNVGVKKVKERVEKHIFFTGKTPVVIIDYLQILAPSDPRATDKQNTDKNILELKRISRDFKTPVIGISSFNRQSYNQPVGMESFKESGAVEYSADVLLGLQAKGAGKDGFDINESKKKIPREVELVVLKNRNGSTGNKLEYRYHTPYNYYCEYEDNKFTPCFSSPFSKA